MPRQPAPAARPRAEDVCGLGLMLSRYEVAGGVKESIPAGAFCLTLRRLSTAESELAINGRRWPARATATDRRVRRCCPLAR